MSAPLLRTDLVTVFRLRVFVSRERAEQVRNKLRTLPGVRHVLVTEDPGNETAVVTTEVHPSAADGVLGELSRIGVGAQDLSLSRDERITLGGALPTASQELAWTAVLSEARAHAHAGRTAAAPAGRGTAVRSAR